MKLAAKCPHWRLKQLSLSALAQEVACPVQRVKDLAGLQTAKSRASKNLLLNMLHPKPLGETDPQPYGDLGVMAQATE
jgi:hypothetical protein